MLTKNSSRNKIAACDALATIQNTSLRSAIIPTWNRILPKVLLIAWLLVIANPIEVKADPPFTDMAAFGASFSRSESRLTNGLVWNEWLASQLDVPAAATTGTNYAAGGNTTRQMQGQVAQYLEEHEPSDSTIITFGLVANDFIQNSTDAAGSAANLVGMVSQLADAGAKHFVIPVQTLGLSPNVRNRGASGFTTFFADVETELATGLGALQAEKEITIHRPDWVAVFDEIVTNPNDYGFTDTNLGSGKNAVSPHEWLWWDGWHPTTAAHRMLGDAAFDLMDVEQPRRSIAVGAEEYVQDFEGLGSRNLINVPLPDGWLGSTNNATYSTITGDFANKVGVGGAMFNIGTSGDRALGLGTTSATEQYELQLLVNVDEIDSTSLQIQFDIEAWSINQNLAAVPGEAAFGVTIDAKQDGTYMPLLDFGVVTTGITLESRRSRVDGELDANHTSFDSGVVPVDLPAGSEIRIRWTTPNDRPTTGWTYGLDNVTLDLGVFGLPGDLNGDGQIDVADMDLLAREVWSPTGEYDSDLNGDGIVGQADIDELLIAANRLRGDADFDGEVQFPDFLILSEHFGQSPATWSMGDFDADGEIQFPDFLFLSENFGKTASSLTAVPEPKSMSQLILLLAMSLLGRRTSRRSASHRLTTPE